MKDNHYPSYSVNFKYAAVVHIINTMSVSELPMHSKVIKLSVHSKVIETTTVLSILSVHSKVLK